MSRAAYMREYRKNRKAAKVVAERPSDGGTEVEKRTTTRPDLDPSAVGRSQLRNTEAAFWETVAERDRLADEVHRLKRALAQANRDLILSRVNRSK